MDCKIIIPSKGRSKNVLTTKMVDNAIICVAESEKNEYSIYNTNNEIITHPDDIIGLSNKRNWIRNYFGDVFMLDDDCTMLRRLYTDKNEASKTTPQETYMLIQNIYHCAIDSGAFLFGFNHSNAPMFFNAHKPIQLTGYIPGHAIGVRKENKLHFGHSTAVEDYFISGINAYFYRIIWKDNRFYVVQKDTFCNVGGLSYYRTMESEKNDTEYLKKMFGDSIQSKKETYKTSQNQTIRSKNQYGRSLIINF